MFAESFVYDWSVAFSVTRWPYCFFQYLVIPQEKYTEQQQQNILQNRFVFCAKYYKNPQRNAKDF